MNFEYQIIEESEDNLNVQLFLKQNMDAFDGHFSGLPILPAVAQLYIVEKIAKTHFVNLGCFTAMHQVKFMNPISPGGVIEIALCWRPLKGLLTFAYILENEIKSKGRLQYSYNGKGT
ncbi:MAG: hypothetical protein L3J52_05085 [Proteobacteria bacterium]|nr:hypothetical protein [Pseudomonadota bacterium]